MQQNVIPNTAEIAAKVVDGEAILINLSSGMYYSMDAVGGVVWSLIQSGLDLSAISSAVAKRYSVDEDRVKRDVEVLVQQLIDEKIVIPGDTEPGTGEVDIAEDLGTDDYAAPQLSKFDDMVDLFALDPPLPELSKLNGRD
jgi:hypothetical protein